MNVPWRPAWWSRLGNTRGRLIGLVVVAALPITAMAGIIAWQDYQGIARASQERATLLEGQVLAGHQAAIGTLAASLQAIATLNPASCGRFRAVDPSLRLFVVSGADVSTCDPGAQPAFPPPPYPWARQAATGVQQTLVTLGPGTTRGPGGAPARRPRGCRDPTHRVVRSARLAGPVGIGGCGLVVRRPWRCPGIPRPGAPSLA